MKPPVLNVPLRAQGPVHTMMARFSEVVNPLHRQFGRALPHHNSARLTAGLPGATLAHPMAPSPGYDPSLLESESSVLPLHSEGIKPCDAGPASSMISAGTSARV
jgi:hypothetical protein